MSRDIKGVRKFMADKIIAVGSAPGGTGKTTNAVNLSMGLALPPFRKRVVLVDLDPTPRQAYFFKKLEYFGFAPFDPEEPLPTFREYVASTRACLERQQKTLSDAEEDLKRAAASSSGNVEETLRNVKQDYAKRLDEDAQTRIRLEDCLTPALRFSEENVDYFRMPRVISAENPLESLLGEEPGAAQIVTSAFRLLLKDLQAIPDVDYLVLDLGGGMYWNVLLPAAISDIFIPIIRYSPSGEDDLDRVYEMVVKAQRKRGNEYSDWERKQNVEEGKRAELLKKEEGENYEVLSRKFYQFKDLVLGTRAGGGKRGVKGLVSLLELNEIQKEPLRKMFALSEQKLKEGELTYESLEEAFRVCKTEGDDLREKGKLKPKQMKQYRNVCDEIRQAISEERRVGYYNAFHELSQASLDVQASHPFSYPFQHIVPLINLVPSMSLTAPSRARWMLGQFVEKFEEDFGGEGGRRTATINVLPDDAFLVYSSLLVALSKQKPLVTLPFFLASHNHDDDDHKSLFGGLARLAGRSSAYLQRRQAERSSFYGSIEALGGYIVGELGRRKGK